MRRKNDVERVTGRDRYPAEGDEQFADGALERFEHEIDRGNALVDEAIERLPRRCPEHALGVTALDELKRIRPHVEGALAALEEIERRRWLTQTELSRRRAFKMLLVSVKEGRPT